MLMCEARTKKNIPLILSSNGFLLSLHTSHPVKIHLWIPTQANSEDLGLQEPSRFPEPLSHRRGRGLLCHSYRRKSDYFKPSKSSLMFACYYIHAYLILEGKFPSETQVFVKLTVERNNKQHTNIYCSVPSTAKKRYRESVGEKAPQITN